MFQRFAQNIDLQTEAENSEIVEKWAAFKSDFQRYFLPFATLTLTD
jgi:hypothetical protein